MAVVVTTVALAAPAAAWPAEQRAQSLGPPPAKVDSGQCSRAGRGLPRCVDDIWGSRFDFRLAPHVVRVGERITEHVTAAYADPDRRFQTRWTWTAPTGGKVVSCWPPPGRWFDSPSFGGPASGWCTWKMTQPTYPARPTTVICPGGVCPKRPAQVEQWTATSACIAPLGQVYCEQDYYAVLDHKYLLHGYVRDANEHGIAGVRVTFAGRGGGSSYTTTRSDGYYDAILRRGSYNVQGAKSGVKLCATQRQRCENPTTVRMVSDKQLDFGPPSVVVVEGRVRDHRRKGLFGVTVEAAAVGRSGRYRATTDGSGAYRLELPGGTYNVRPVRSGRTNRERYMPDGVYVQRARGSVTEDFTLAPADELDLATSASRLIGGLWWTTAAATGGESAQATVSLENGRGDPVADEPVTVDAPYWDMAPPGSSAPEVVICDDSWRRVYPGNGFERRTDGQGRIGFHMLFGGALGNFFLHARETRDVTVFDVERFAQLGGTIGPTEDIVATLQNATKLGLPKPPLAGATQAKVQQGLLDWLLSYRLGEGLGPGRQSPWGEFGPIRSADGSQGGIVLYPSGDPGPLRARLFNGTPLPAGYRTLAIPIKRVVVLGQETWHVDFGGRAGGLRGIDAWEQEFGPARAGFAGGGGGEGAAWFGGPYPPPSTGGDARAGFDRCLPGTSPQVTAIEVHSPLRLLLEDRAGRRFGYDRKGSLVDGIGGYVVQGTRRRPTTYVVPSGTYAVALTGTAGGVVTIVVRTARSGGNNVQVFSLRSRRGAIGTLKLTTTGPRSVRFAGHTVRAQNGIGMRISGLPRRLTSRRRLTIRLRVTDQFGQPVSAATVAVGRSRYVSADNGRTTIAVQTPARGSVLITVKALGHATLKRRVAVTAPRRR